MFEISVVICTHNPREAFLRRVLKALEAQTLPKDRWELILVDNASEARLSEKWPLDWHPHARHVRESTLGLTSARLCGIRESQGEFLVFVDDDNVPAPDYLEAAAKVAHEWPRLGAWGPTIRGEFEEPPPSWAIPHLGTLAVKECAREVWSNDPAHWMAQPCGAGLCLRAGVARSYAESVQANPWKRLLDRQGTNLASCGDSDMVLTACDEGLGFGIFPSMQLLHLIPKERLTEDYLVRLTRAMHVSGLILDSFRSGRSIETPSQPSRPALRPSPDRGPA
jgi:glycosyltransferase involved in cell wall biosynthesis